SPACRRPCGSPVSAAYLPHTPPGPGVPGQERDSLAELAPQGWEVVMRVAVTGATGNIGPLTVAALERDGHETVRLSRSLGVDLLTGEGLDRSPPRTWPTSSPRSPWASRGDA